MSSKLRITTETLRVLQEADLAFVAEVRTEAGRMRWALAGGDGVRTVSATDHCPVCTK